MWALYNLWAIFKLQIGFQLTKELTAGVLTRIP